MIGFERREQAPKRVIVAGAGMAGLVAAYELARAGHEPVVLEAQNRVGGRVYTLRTFAPGLYAEAGAMRIPRVHALTLGYCEHFGLQLRPFVMGNPKGLVHVGGVRMTAEEAGLAPERLHPGFGRRARSTSPPTSIESPYPEGAMITTPDPIAEAAAYQQSLLDALGDDDPAEAQSETAAAARALIADAGANLRAVPEPGEWSVIECLGHILDAEIVMASRYRWVLAHDQPEIMPYDQAAWVAALRYRGADPEVLFVTFEALRAANLDLWRRSSAVERARVGLHRERGPESFELMFRMIGGHDRVHLAQGRRALEAVRARA